MTEKAIILQSKRAQLEAMREERNEIRAKVTSQRIARECLLMSHQSDLVNVKYLFLSIISSLS
jgi:hypothetical protein